MFGLGLSVLNSTPAPGAGASFIGALDTWGGGKGAWSLYRRLLSSYTGALFRVRRSGDNEEQDFQPASNGLISVAAVEAFCVAGGGSEDGYVVVVYDQSGNGLDLEQSSAGMQMQICYAGAVQVIGSVNAPAMSPTGSNTSIYATAAFTPYGGAHMSCFVNYQSDGLNVLPLALVDGTNSIYSAGSGVPILQFGGSCYGNRNGAYTDTGFAVTTTPNLIYGEHTELLWRAYDVGSSSAPSYTDMGGTFSADRFVVAGLSASSPWCETGFKFVEIVVYLSDVTTDQASIYSALEIFS